MNRVVPCPHCGDLIAEDATFCRHCGSSEADGWSDADPEDGEDDFDYDEYVEKEFGHSPVARTLPPVWRLTAIALLILIVGYALFALSNR